MSADSTVAPESSALEEIAAAERLAADSEIGPGLVKPHLRRAWELLHEKAGTDEDLLSWSGSQIERRAEATREDGVAGRGP